MLRRSHFWKAVDKTRKKEHSGTSRNMESRVRVSIRKHGHRTRVSRSCNPAHSQVVDKTRNMEYSGTFRNIPEHRIIMIIMTKMWKLNFHRLKRPTIWKRQCWNYMNFIIFWSYYKTLAVAKLLQPIELLKSLNDWHFIDARVNVHWSRTRVFLYIWTQLKLTIVWYVCLTHIKTHGFIIRKHW